MAERDLSASQIPGGSRWAARLAALAPKRELAAAFILCLAALVSASFMAARGHASRAETEALIARSGAPIHAEARQVLRPRRDATAPPPAAAADGVGEIAVAYAPVEAFPDATIGRVARLRTHAAPQSALRAAAPRLDLAALSITRSEADVRPVEDPALTDARPVVSEKPPLAAPEPGALVTADAGTRPPATGPPAFARA